MVDVKIESGDFPTARGSTGGNLDRVIGKWQRKITGGFNEGAEWLLLAIEEVDELRLWERYNSGLYPMDRNGFIAQHLLLDFDVVESTIPAILERLKNGEAVELERKDGGKVELVRKIAEARERPLAANGTNQHGGDAKRGVYNINPSSPRGGTGTAYTLRRLARDAPELLDRIESGELTVNAAAIAAGIRKRATPEDTCLKAWRKAGDRVGVLLALIAELTDEEREAFQAELESVSSR